MRIALNHTTTGTVEDAEQNSQKDMVKNLQGQASEQAFETKQFNLGKKKILHLLDMKRIGGCSGKNFSEHFEKKIESSTRKKFTLA